MTQSETQSETQNEFIYNSELIEEQRAVVKIQIEGEDWFMDYDDFKLAEEEGRTKPVIYGDKLILVDDEVYNELEKLMNWMDGNKK